MYHTYKDQVLADALIDLVGFLNSPQRDDLILREAAVTLDKALFPLLVRLGARGTLSVAELAEQIGRDHSTVSRQVSKLESQGLVARRARDDDQRVRAAEITRKGHKVVRAISEARQRLWDKLFVEWNPKDREAVGRLVRKLADSMLASAIAAQAARKG